MLTASNGHGHGHANGTHASKQPRTGSERISSASLIQMEYDHSAHK